MSTENQEYINKRDDIEFRINTALSSEECREKQINNAIRLSNPILTNNQPLHSIKSKASIYESELEAKPEELYIDYYYREYSQPRLQIEVSVNDNFMASKSDFDLYGSLVRLNSMPGKVFRIIGINYYGETNLRTLTLKQVETEQSL